MKRILLFCSLVILFQPEGWCQLSNTGWKSPMATHLPNGWTNPLNAFIGDDVYTTVAHGSGCRCPFVELSWDNGNTYTSTQLFGPYGTVDSYRIQGDSTDTWGHAWTVQETNDTNFVLRIWNPSTVIRQGYTAFQLGIPAGSIISGIEVQVEEHGDSNFTMEFIDLIQVKVYFDISTFASGNSLSENNFRIYPNPAHHILFIRNSSGENYMAAIYNNTGAMISEGKYSAEPVNSIDISSLANGFYFLRLHDGHNFSYMKFLKQ